MSKIKKRDWKKTGAKLGTIVGSGVGYSIASRKKDRVLDNVPVSSGGKLGKRNIGGGASLKGTVGSTALGGAVGGYLGYGAGAVVEKGASLIKKYKKRKKKKKK